MLFISMISYTSHKNLSDLMISAYMFNLASPLIKHVAVKTLFSGHLSFNKRIIFYLYIYN